MSVALGAEVVSNISIIDLISVSVINYVIFISIYYIDDHNFIIIIIQFIDDYFII